MKPCPFCGSTNQIAQPDETLPLYIECVNCGAIGPRWPNKDNGGMSIRDAWNLRRDDWIKEMEY
jgi:Zn ribbon nucleic-acid-binding protein